MKKRAQKPKLSIEDLGATVDPTAPKNRRKGRFRRKEMLSSAERDKKIEEIIEWANNR